MPELVAAYATPTGGHCNGASTTEGEAQAYAQVWAGIEGTRIRSLLHDDGWHDLHLHGRVAQG